MKLAGTEFAIGVDFTVNPHGRCREVHDVQPLLAIHGDERLTEHEHFSKHEGADILPGPSIDHLGVNLGFFLAAEIDDPEFAGLPGFSGNSDLLLPVGHSRTLVEQDPVAGSAFTGTARHADDRGGGEISRLTEIEDL